MTPDPEVSTLVSTLTKERRTGRTPDAPAGRVPYGHHWRTYVRPVILERDEHRCLRCRRPWRLEIAHLDADPRNNDPANLATLCRTCHRAHDYAVWAARCRETRGARKDAGRPLLVEAAL